MTKIETMKNQSKVYQGLNLQKVKVSDLSIGERFYNNSMSVGIVLGFGKNEDGFGIAFINWIPGRSDGSCWSNDLCWKIIKN